MSDKENNDKKYFTPKFLEGEIVYFKTDLEQLPYIVIGYLLSNKRVTYNVQHNLDASVFALEFELSLERDISLINEFRD